MQELETGPLHRFGDWPNEQVPKRAAGVYSSCARSPASAAGCLAPSRDVWSDPGSIGTGHRRRP
jgi:hypothetical protein